MVYTVSTNFVPCDPTWSENSEKGRIEFEL
jgi:hypothetical protein